MQINPGGRLNTKDVMGRDNEIARYWDVLDRQGPVISAERRIGKTHIVLKMRDECRSGYLPIYQDLEFVRSIADLIRSIYGTVQEHSSTSPGVRARFAKWSGPASSLARLAGWTCRRRTAIGRFSFRAHSKT